MRNQRSKFLRFFVSAAGFPLLWLATASAQNAVPETRITRAVDNAELTLLKGNVHSMARPEFDRGAAPLNLPMERMTLVLRSTPEQQAALATLLDEQQDQSSPNYHKWLTPTQFGQQFGASEQDIQTITSWLRSQGFQVNHVANGHNAIEFSGTAGQVQQAFHTAIHKYSVPNSAGVIEDRWANWADPQIPAALAPVVIGVATLHNFLKAPQHILSSEKFRLTETPGHAPEFTGTSNGAVVHAVTPGDLAVIYNSAPLYAASPAIDGTGATVAVVARSNVDIEDLSDFRGHFGPPGALPEILVNGTDPGPLGGGEQVEATLDASYAMALSPGATEIFVVSASTNTADGVDLSEMFIIDNNLGDVMTESFGGCEVGVTSSEATAISNLAEQAAAQGITYLVSTGDNGSAGCDDPKSPLATHGVSVNVLASTPYTIGVGGTVFNEGATPTTYWNAMNNGVLTSARSYIPEDVWNQSCAVAACGSSQANLVAASGGVSALFVKPSWQSGVTGIPATGDRNLPDVSLTAAGHDPYLICLEGSCQQSEFEGVGGTSASVQAFGGIIALVRQKTKARVGQADYVLYKLAAAESLANCNGSQALPVPATNCIFYDTTVGNNAVPGTLNYGTPTADYQTTVGYDRATGLGSVNIENLVNQWSSVSFAPSVTTLTITPASFTHGATATFNIAVAPKTGTPSFTNEMAALLSSTGSAVDDVLLSSTGTASGTTNLIPGGMNTVTAHYPGDGTLGASDSTPVAVNVAPEPSTTTISITNSSGAAFTGGPYGSPIILNSTVTGQSGFGIPSGLLDFNDGALSGFFEIFLDRTGKATPNGAYFTTVGSHSINASYEGDASFKASASAPVTFTITLASTTTSVQASPSSAAPGGSVTLTANVAAATGGPSVPGGSVTFFSGSTSLGSVFVNATSTLDATASISTSQLATGANSITAKYSGDSDYQPSTSTAIIVNVALQPDFAISAAPSPVTVTSPGQSAMTTVTVAGVNGFSGVATFSCTGLPSKSACAFLPATVTGSGATMLTVTTTAASGVGLGGRNTFNNWTATSGAIRALVFSAALCILAVQIRRRRWNFAGTLFVVALLLSTAACGGGGGGTPPPVIPGTPAGTTTVTVTATSAATASSAAITHSTTFTLMVN